jgi:hypothetical protein
MSRYNSWKGEHGGACCDTSEDSGEEGSRRAVDGRLLLSLFTLHVPYTLLETCFETSKRFKLTETFQSSCSMKPFKTCKYVKIDGFKLPIKHEVWNGDMRWLELLVRSLCTLSRLAPLYDGQGRWLCVGKADSIPPPGECKCFFVLGSTAAKKLSSSEVTPCAVWLIETSSTAAVCI